LNKKGMMLIDEYIELVQTRLPASIAEDVGIELRSYLEAAALDVGNGEITEDSAKRAIAAFGAPADVASEYTESLIHKQQNEVRSTITDTYFENVKESVIWKMIFLIALGHLFMIPAAASVGGGNIYLAVMSFSFFTFMVMIWVLGIALVGTRFYFKRKRSQIENGNGILGKRGYPTQSIDLIISLFVLIPVSLSLVSLEYFSVHWENGWGNLNSFLFNFTFGLTLIIIGLTLRVVVFALNALGKSVKMPQMILVFSGILLCISYGFIAEVLYLYPFALGSIRVTWLICSWVLLPIVAFDTSLTDTKIKMIEKRRKMLSLDESENKEVILHQREQ